MHVCVPSTSTSRNNLLSRSGVCVVAHLPAAIESQAWAPGCHGDVRLCWSLHLKGGWDCRSVGWSSEPERHCPNTHVRGGGYLGCAAWPAQWQALPTAPAGLPAHWALSCGRRWLVSHHLSVAGGSTPPTVKSRAGALWMNWPAQAGADGLLLCPCQFAMAACGSCISSRWRKTSSSAPPLPGAPPLPPVHVGAS